MVTLFDQYDREFHGLNLDPFGMFPNIRTRFRRVAAIFAVIIAAAGCYWGGFLAPIDNGLAALRMSLTNRKASGSIVLLEIDNRSLSAIGTWPWKRSIYADLVRKTFSHGAEELAFDIDFSAHSHQGQDFLFAQALSEAQGPVTLAIFQQYQNARKGDHSVKINRPIEELSQNAWAATVNVLADSDGIVRRFPYAQFMEGELVSSLASSLGGYQHLHAGDFLIDMSIDAATVPVYSIIDLLKGRLPPDVFVGKKVIVGAGAAELRDTLAVPVYGMMTGPMLQVLAAEAILQKRDLQPQPILWLVVCASLVLGWVLWVFFGSHHATYSKLLRLALLGVVLEIAAFILYLNSHFLLETALLHLLTVSLGSLMVLLDVRLKDVLLSLSRKRNQSLVNLLETIVEDSFSGILISSQDGELIEVSDQARQMLASMGYQTQKGDHLDAALPPAIQAAFRACLDDPHAYQAHSLQELSLHRSKDDDPSGRGWEEVILEFSITPSLVSSGEFSKNSEHWVATLMFHDVTKARKEQRRLAYLVDHDALTGFYNENGFCQSLDRKMVADMQQNAVILACQVRRLDKISQSLGSDYGDLLIQQISQKFSELDEFDLLGCSAQHEILLCKLGAGPQEADRLSRLIADVMESPLSLRGHHVIAGSYIGVADFLEGGQVAEEVCRAALVAMNRSKELGGTYLRYSSDLAADVMHRRVLEREIIDAVDRDEFEMHYQPQAALDSGEIIGCEALIRWKHRDLGMIRPDLFIPIMEESGLIVDVGRWILNQVCQDATGWAKPINVAANVSAIQFARSDLLDDLDRALDYSGLEEGRLQIEITESLFISDPTATVRLLSAIQARKIAIALDDFGTGYSSLSYIHQFPLDKIKIDQAFVKNLPHSMDSMAVINAIVALARNFDMDIVAEGVETAEQHHVLKMAGCHIGQGWHFGKPMPNADFAALLDKQEPPLALDHRVA